MSSRGPADLSWVPRRYGQWAAAVLFVLVMALAAGWLWNQKNDRREVLAVAGSVPAGTVIDRGDLRVEKVAGVDHTIGVGGVDDVVGSTAVVGLVPGQVLSRDMLTTEAVPGPGERVVGVELDATRAPDGLAPGDSVVVLAVPPSGDASRPSALADPTILAEKATVSSGTSVEDGATRLTLVVSQDQADRVAAFGAAGRVAVVQAPAGGVG